MHGSQLAVQLNVVRYIFSRLNFTPGDFDCQGGSGLVSEENALTTGGAVPAHVESSYVVSLRDLDMKHVKDFTFLHGETTTGSIDYVLRNNNPLAHCLFDLFGSILHIRCLDVF